MSRYILILPIVYLLSLILTEAIRRYAIKKDIVDIPGERSSHTTTTPRGGGVAIILAFYLGMLIDHVLYAQQSYLIAMLFALPVVIVGALDDHGHVKAGYRLLVHLFSAAFMLMYLIHSYGIFLSDNPLVSLFLTGGVIVVTAWLINLYNFMDGIDGIASVEIICISLGVMVILSLGILDGRLVTETKIQAASNIMLLLAILIVAVAGFLKWNWPPAKIFMGDAGSGFLGMVVAITGLLSWFEGLMHAWSWFILLAVFIGDATFTLVRRFLAGERWYAAHCSHAYQHLARRLASHKRVNVLVILVNLLWLLPLAVMAELDPEKGALYMLIAYVPLLFIIYWIVSTGQKRKTDKNAP